MLHVRTLALTSGPSTCRLAVSIAEEAKQAATDRQKVEGHLHKSLTSIRDALQRAMADMETSHGQSQVSVARIISQMERIEQDITAFRRSHHAKLEELSQAVSHPAACLQEHMLDEEMMDGRKHSCIVERCMSIIDKAADTHP